ncbi:MAG TPA: 30S ribosomal protein S2 [Acidimicrobiales bacterium]|nr:30S ribosomal protein S2 [Acidimicrobiales bacterium]
MAVVTMKQLLEAGVHFGHQTRRWNPKMKRFIFGERNGIYIIDLNQTLERVDTAYSYVRDLVAGGGVILFVGTKKQTQDPVAEFATACGMPYVNQRWLGGMLTNFQTVAGRVRKLVELEASRAAGDFAAMPKKEALSHERELEKLDRNLGGLRRLDRPPDAIFVIDTKKEHIAVTEANKLHLPVVAVVDTNCDPDVIDYVIPGNDDAIRAGRLMCRVIADAVAEGRYIASRRAADAVSHARRAGLEATAQASTLAVTERKPAAMPLIPAEATPPSEAEVQPAEILQGPAEVAQPAEAVLELDADTGESAGTTAMNATDSRDAATPESSASDTSTPATPAEVVAAEPTVPAEPASAAEPTVPAEPASAAEPTAAAEPTESTEPAGTAGTGTED